MDIGQQALWLSAGLFTDRRMYIPELAKFFSEGEELRVRHVIDFLVPSGAYQQCIMQRFNGWNPDEIRQMIQALGKCIEPPISQESAGSMNDDQAIRHKFQSLFRYCVGVIKKQINDKARESLDYWQPMTVCLSGGMTLYLPKRNKIDIAVLKDTHL